MAEDSGENGQVGRDGELESVEDKNGEEDVEEEGHSKNAAFEFPGMPVEGCEVYVIMIEGGEEGLESGGSWDERGWD